MFRRGLTSIMKELTYLRNEILHIPQEIMMETVKNTHEYHNFIPWCKDSKIIKKISQAQNHTQLTISFNDLREISYTSHVLIEQKQDGCTITSICKESPLKYLKSVWIIKKHGETQTNVNYFLDFQFDSVLYQLTSSIFLNIMGKSMMDIFVKRAKETSRLRGYNIRGYNISANFMQQEPLKYNIDSKPNQKQVAHTDNQYENYVNSRPKLKQLMQKNQQISRQLQKIARRFPKTNNFTEKMNFQVRNLLTHHNISPQSDLIKQIQ